MLNGYTDIIKLVMLGLDIFFVLILLRFVLTGLRRGFARNCFRLVLIVVLVLFFSIGCKGIIRNIIEMELPINYDVYANQVTIKNIVETIVADNLFDGNIVELQKSGLTTLIEDVVVSAVSIVLFTIMSILIYLIIAPIITLICKIFLPFLRKKRYGQKVKYGTLSKLLGLGCSLVRFAILMMIFFVPLYGALEIGKVVVDEAALVDKDMNELSTQLDEAVGNSVMLKLTSNIGKNKDGAFGLGAKTLGSRFLISTEYANINIVKEIDAVGGYLPRAIELYYEIEDTQNINEVVDLVEEKDVKVVTNYLADSKLIKVAYPVAMNYLDANEDLLELDIEIDFKDLAKIDISKDLKKLEPFFVSVLNCAKQIDLENIDVWEILENKVVVEEALDAVNIILNLEITDKLVLKLGTKYLNDMFKENNLEHLVDLINNDYLKNKLITDIKSLYNAYLLLDDSGIIDYFANEEIEEFEITEQVTTNLKEFVEIIFNLELIKNQEKKIVQTIFVFTEFDTKLYADMINEDIDWNKEVNSVGEIITTVIEMALLIDLDTIKSGSTLDYLELLDSEELVNSISEILNIALAMQLSEKYVLPLVIEYVEDFLETCDLEEFNGIIDVEYIKYSLVNDINQLVDAYKLVKKTDLIEYFMNKANEFEFDKNVEKYLTRAFDKIIELELVKGNEKALVSYIVSTFANEVEIDFDGMLEENIDWSLELHTLADVVIDALEFIVTCEFDKNDIESLLENEKFIELFPGLVDKVFTLQTAEKYVAPIVIDMLSELFVEIGFDKFTNYITPEYLKNGLSTDLTNIFEIFDEFKALGFEEILKGNSQISIDLKDENRLRNVITEILNLNVIDGHESEILITFCDMYNLGEYISYDEDSFKNVDWDAEKDDFIDVLIAILNVSKIESFDEKFFESENYEETTQQLGKLFDALIKCEITKDFAFDLVNSLVANIGYEIELSESDKIAIEVNTGETEFKILANIAKDIIDLFSSSDSVDYSKLRGEDVSRLMTDASKGVIASKVMGTALNEVLDKDGLDIMPKDPDTGLNLYDFTKQKTLKEQAVNIGNCIDLVNNLQSFDANNIESITNIASSLETLGSLQGNDNIVEDLLTELLPAENIEISENVDWSEEAELVEDVLNLYKESDDKNAFEITDSELSDKVEDSELAKYILDYLGIFNNE